jgi:hypothetical protein
MNKENNNPNDETPAGEKSWFERNVNLCIAGLVVACVATLVAQAVYSPLFDEHHPAHFEQEKIFGYSAMFGFAAFVGVVFLGRFLRLIVKRPEDYYDK